MTRFTQKQLKEMVLNGIAIDISNGTNETRREILTKEEYYTQVGFVNGTYGCSGQLLKGHKTNQLYAIIGRTQAIYIF